MERRRAREQEAAVAPARAAGDGPPLEQQDVEAAARQAPRARQPADPAADHAHVDLGPALERRARLVRRVEPERRGRLHSHCEVGEANHCALNHPGFVDAVDDRALRLEPAGARLSQFAPVHPRALESGSPYDVRGPLAMSQSTCSCRR